MAPPSAKTGLWTGAVMSAGAKLSAQRRILVSRIDPVLVMLSCLHMVDRKRLNTVAALLLHLKNKKSAEVHPQQEIRAWLESGPMLISEQPSASGLVSTFSEFVKSLTMKEGAGRVASIVVEMMLHSASRGDVREALLSALEDIDSSAPGYTSSHISDGLESPHVVTQEHYLPPGASLFPATFRPSTLNHAMQSLHTWHDPRKVPFWDVGVEELIANAYFAAEHNSLHCEETSVPLSIYASCVLPPVVYCVWTVEPIPHPVSKWGVVPPEELELCFHHTESAKAPSDFHLSPGAVKDIASALNVYDQQGLQEMLTGGRWDAGVLAPVHLSHGMSVFRYTLSRSLPSGLDVLFLVRYENGSKTSYSPTEPLATSVVWLPPVWQAFNPSPFRLGALPPSGIVEYLHSRGNNEKLRGEGWCSYPFTRKYLTLENFINQCRSDPQPHRHSDAVYDEAVATIARLPKAKQVVEGICWRAQGKPVQEWLNISLADIKKLANEKITCDEQAVTWMAYTEDDSQMGDAWLINLTAPFLTSRHEDCLTFLSGKCLDLMWVPVKEKLSVDVPEQLNGKLALAKKMIPKLQDCGLKALQFQGTTASIVDLSDATAVLADQTAQLIVHGTKIDPTDITSTLLQNMFRELCDPAECTPAEIADALSLQFLEWGSTTYLCSLSGKRKVMACVTTEEMCILQRLSLEVPNQPYRVLNSCIRSVKNGCCDAVLTVEKGAGGSYQAAPSTFVFTHKEKSGTWSDNADIIGSGWVLLIPQQVFVKEEAAALEINGWMIDQVRPYAYYLDKALQQLPPKPRKSVRNAVGILLNDIYTTSAVVLWSSYSSSLDCIQLRPEEKQAVLSIKGAPRDITPWNWTLREKHYVFPPNSMFQVVRTSCKDKHQNIELREVGVGESLEIFIRTIIPTLTYRRAPDYIRQLFNVMQEVEKQHYERALRIAVMPHKEMLGRSESIDASDGLTITRELMRLVDNEAVCGTLLQHALLEASKTGAHCAVSRIVSLGTSPDCTDDEKNAPLHLAAGYGCEKTVRELLDVGASPEMVTQGGETVLHVAVRVMKLFVDDTILPQLCGPTTINASDVEGETPLQHAVINEANETIETLIGLGADPNMHITTTSKKKNAKPKAWTVLHLAASMGSVSSTKELVQNGADPEISDSTGQVPLHLAIESQAFVTTEGLEVIARLVTFNSVQKRDKQHASPLHIAASLGQLEVAKLLLNFPAAERLNLPDKIDVLGHTPLHAAALMFEIDTVLFLKHLTKISLKRSDFQRNRVQQAAGMLHEAVCNDEIEKVGLLLECGVVPDVDPKDGSLLHVLCLREAFGSEEGVKVIEMLCKKSGGDRKDGRGKTALHAAAEVGLVPIIKVLLQQTADPNIPDEDGRTVIHCACLRGSMDVLYVLVWYDRLVRKLPADLNLVDKQGKTPLYIAAECGHVSIVRFLLEEGVDKSVRSAAGHTAEEIASINQHIGAVHLILGHEGKINLPPAYARMTLFKTIYRGDVTWLRKLLDIYEVDTTLLSDKGTNMLQEIAKHPGMNNPEGREVTAILMSNEMSEFKADDPVVGSSVNPLHIACYYGHTHVVAALLEGGASPDTPSGDGMLPIQYAASKLRVGVVFIMQKNSAYRVTIADFPISSLHRAAELGNVGAVRMLLDYGLSPADADCYEGTPSGKLCIIKGSIVGAVPLHYAVLRSEFSVGEGLKALRRLAEGRAVKAITINQRSTALHFAAVTWHDGCEVMKMLLEMGADPDAKDAKGQTALDMAVGHGSVQIVQLLANVTQHKLDVTDLLQWASSDVLIHSAAQEVHALCDTWLATHSTLYAELIAWTPLKSYHLGQRGKVIISKNDFVKVEFFDPVTKEQSYECYPRAAVTRMIFLDR